MLIETFDERLTKAYTDQFGKESKFAFAITKAEEVYSFQLSSTQLNFSIKRGSYNELFDCALRMLKAWTPVTRNRTPQNNTENTETTVIENTEATTEE